MSRERDIRNAIQTALVATDAFDVDANTGAAVFIWGLPEDFGTGASVKAAAAIVPMSEPPGRPLGRGTDWRPGRHGPDRDHAPLPRPRPPDPRRRGRAAARHDRQRLERAEPGRASRFPQTTRIIQWDWQPVTVPERRINTILSVQYIVPDWTGYDTTP